MKKDQDLQTVDAYINKLDTVSAEIVEFIRKTILAVDVILAEHIKWNSPAFYYTGQMQAFNPKEYKRDLAVINNHRGNILLIFPTGAKIKDPAGLTATNYEDGRKIIKINTLEDAKAKANSLTTITKAWLAQIEK